MDLRKRRSTPEKRKAILSRKTDRFGFFKVFLYLQKLIIYFGKQTVLLKKDSTKLSRVSLLFDLNLQYRSINYAISKLLPQFSFAAAFKMEL